MCGWRGVGRLFSGTSPRPATSPGPARQLLPVTISPRGTTMAGRAASLSINRAPVLTLWAAVTLNFIIPRLQPVGKR